MTRRVVVLRPEPGNAATVARLVAAGLHPVSLPLFATQALDWTLPPGPFDGLLLTSAATPRLAGAGLAAVAHLPVVAVGQVTAQAAWEAGLVVSLVGDSDASALVISAATAGYRRLLHLGARDGKVSSGGVIAAAVAIYASEPLRVSETQGAQLSDSVVMVHSPRAGARLASIADDMLRRSICVIAISEAAAAATGSGWAHVAAVERPDDGAMIECARALARSPIDRRRAPLR